MWTDRDGPVFALVLSEVQPANTSAATATAHNVPSVDLPRARRMPDLHPADANSAVKGHANAVVQYRPADGTMRTITHPTDADWRVNSPD
jgi:hypothetical protein